MKEIFLTQGKVALVDDEDFGRSVYVNWHAYKGYKTYYAMGTVSTNCELSMHKFIMGFTKNDGKSTDHKNHNGLDNRKCNLRLCSDLLNQRNRRKIMSSSSMYKGVSWRTDRSRWIARITLNKKTIFLGCFDTEKQAAIVYNQKAKELFGEFACLNKI